MGVNKSNFATVVLFNSHQLLPVRYYYCYSNVEDFEMQSSFLLKTQNNIEMQNSLQT